MPSWLRTALTSTLKSALSSSIPTTLRRADLTVNILKTGGVHSWDPKDGAVQLFVAKAEGSLEGNLVLPRSLMAILW